MDYDPMQEKVEQIFELNQENIHLRGQITYLQEQMSSLEDEKSAIEDRLMCQISELENQLSNVLYGNNQDEFDK